jgi:hypothetical protein
MDPAIFLALAEKNGPDIEAILAKIPITTLLALAPHLYAILNTIQQQGKTS